MGELLIFIVLLLLYFTPTIIAHSRSHRNATGVTLLNIFLGWTVLGWLGAFLWSLQIHDAEKKREVEVTIKKGK